MSAGLRTVSERALVSWLGGGLCCQHLPPPAWKLVRVWFPSFMFAFTACVLFSFLKILAAQDGSSPNPDQESPCVRPALSCASRVRLHASHRALRLTSTVCRVAFQAPACLGNQSALSLDVLGSGFPEHLCSSAPLFQKFPELSWPQWFLSYFLYFVTLLFLCFTGQAGR